MIVRGKIRNRTKGTIRQDSILRVVKRQAMQLCLSLGLVAWIQALQLRKTFSHPKEWINRKLQDRILPNWFCRVETDKALVKISRQIQRCSNSFPSLIVELKTRLVVIRRCPTNWWDSSRPSSNQGSRPLTAPLTDVTLRLMVLSWITVTQIRIRITQGEPRTHLLESWRRIGEPSITRSYRINRVTRLGMLSSMEGCSNSRQAREIVPSEVPLIIIRWTQALRVPYLLRSFQHLAATILVFTTLAIKSVLARMQWSKNVSISLVERKSRSNSTIGLSLARHSERSKRLERSEFWAVSPTPISSSSTNQSTPPSTYTW